MKLISNLLARIVKVDTFYCRKRIKSLRKVQRLVLLTMNHERRDGQTVLTKRLQNSVWKGLSGILQTNDGQAGLSANKSVGKIPQKISRSPRQKHGRRKSAGILQTKHKHKTSTWFWYTFLRESPWHYPWMKGTRYTYVIFSLRPASCHKSRQKRRRHTFATWLHQPPLCFMF